MEKSFDDFITGGDKVSCDESFIRFEAQASATMLSAEELQALGLIKTLKNDEAVSDDDVEQMCGLVHDGYYGRSRSTCKSQQSDLPCEVPDVTNNRSKRLSDEDMKREAYATSHVTSFACTSSCSFQCSQKITFYGQRQQFLDYWGPKESKDTISTKQRKANLVTYMKRAYDKEKKTFRFFTVKSGFVPSFEICEYAAAHCLCINPHTSRIWETSKKIAKSMKYDSLGKELSDSDIDGNTIVISFAKTNTDSNLCRKTSPLKS